MNDDEIAAYFIRHLSEYDNPNDLILEICEKTGRTWTDVQAILERVRAEHEHEITLRQSPAVILAALLIFLGGLGIAAYSLSITIETIQAYTGTTVQPLGIPDALQALGSAAYTGIAGLLLGTAMVLGSTIGMRKVWVAILKL